MPQQSRNRNGTQSCQVWSSWIRENSDRMPNTAIQLPRIETAASNLGLHRGTLIEVDNQTSQSSQPLSFGGA